MKPFVDTGERNSPIFGKMTALIYEVRCPRPVDNENIWRFEGIFSSKKSPPQGMLPVRFRILFDADENFAARKRPFKLENFMSAEGMAKALMSVLQQGTPRQEVQSKLDEAGIDLRNSYERDGKKIDVYRIRPDPLLAYVGWDDGQLLIAEYDSRGQLLELRGRT